MNPSIDNSAARPLDTIDPYNGYINADDAARFKTAKPFSRPPFPSSKC